MMNVYAMAKRMEELKEEGQKLGPAVTQPRKQMKWPQVRFWKQYKPAACCPTCC
ncbi:hypothetical protein [Halobacillus sp. A5]|uniref:hypothetical protein n=1 Tax=Halobacillus sp. A5 TaxID=2880263 RepID=UPI0020A6B4DE|nr:hypothetical protein [Halobacillus sp. A5]MCP3028462.1 hypothetical protein [Halobacillus sp. A5]